MRFQVKRKTPEHVYVNTFFEGALNGTLTFTHEEWEELKSSDHLRVVTVDTHGNTQGE